jgi:hypothetical protein
VLAIPAAPSENIATSQVFFLKQAVAFLAEEVAFMHSAFGYSERQAKIEPLLAMVTTGQANARYAIVEIPVAAFGAEKPLGLELGHMRLHATRNDRPPPKIRRALQRAGSDQLNQPSA